MTETLTKDGQVYFQNSQQGSDIDSQNQHCLVSTSFADSAAASNGATSLPPGRYHFELTTGSEVLSTGDLTVVSAG